MNAYPIGNDLTVKWSLLYSDGSVFPLSNYDYELSYRTNRGNKVVTDTSVISVDENILTWTFKGDEQVVSGRYTICLKITLSGSRVVELQYDNAFMLSPLSGFKGAGSEIVLQSYCDAIDLKEAVLQSRKAMDMAAEAVKDASDSADAAAVAEVIAAQAKTEAESARAMATEANSNSANAQEAAVNANNAAVSAQQSAKTASDHITSLKQAISELPDGQAVSEKVAEHTIQLSELDIKMDEVIGVNKKISAPRNVYTPFGFTIPSGTHYFIKKDETTSIYEWYGDENRTKIDFAPNVLVEFIAKGDVIGLYNFGTSCNVQIVIENGKIQNLSKRIDEIDSNIIYSSNVIGIKKSYSLGNDGRLKFGFTIKKDEKYTITKFGSAAVYELFDDDTYKKIELNVNVPLSVTATRDVVGLYCYGSGGTDVTLEYNKIGNVAELNTNSKEVVGAINECANKLMLNRRYTQIKTVSSGGNINTADANGLKVRAEVGQVVHIRLRSKNNVDTPIKYYLHLANGKTLGMSASSSLKTMVYTPLDSPLVEVGMYKSGYPQADEITLEVKCLDDSIPSYYFDNDYLPNKIADINAASNEILNGDTFLWMTDTHYAQIETDAPYGSMNANMSQRLVKYIYDHTPVTKILHGGDFVEEDLRVEEVKQLINAIGSKNLYISYGNHDCTDSIAKQYSILHSFTDDVIWGDVKKSYGYFDNLQQKFRYINLCAFICKEDESKAEHGYNQAQLDWLTSTALNISSDWTVVIFCHTMYGINTNDELIVNNNSQSFINAIDTAKSNGVDIACVLMGHTHVDRMHIGASGVPYIISQCDRFARWHENDPMDIRYSRLIGTKDEVHFEFVTINKDTRKVKLICIGADAGNGFDNQQGDKVSVREVEY